MVVSEASVSMYLIIAVTNTFNIFIRNRLYNLNGNHSSLEADVGITWYCIKFNINHNIDMSSVFAKENKVL